MLFALTPFDLNTLASRWWVLILRGIAALLFGVLAIIWPGISVLALVYLWGAYAVADGVFSFGLAARAGAGGRRGGWLFSGLVSIAAGALAFVSPTMTALALLTLIAVWSVCRGVFEIVAAIELRRVIDGEWLLALSGVTSIAFGLLMLVFPGAGALGVLTIIAAYSMAFGVLLIALGIRLHRASTAGHQGLPAGTRSHA